MKRALKIIVTAGPTREPIDPVRFISNYSTGKTGLAIAREAQEKGHDVILIHGPLQYSLNGMKTVAVSTAGDMKKAVKKYFDWCDCLVMAAAVADYRPVVVSKRKMHKNSASLTLRLVKNPDILKEIGKDKGGKTLVGFALETENLLKNAKRKLKEKNLDLIIANKVSKNGRPFGEGKNDYVLVNNKVSNFKSITKENLARVLLEKLEKAAW